MEILEGHNKFYVNDTQGNQVAEIVFVPAGNRLGVVKHTGVDSSLKGQGVGKQLVAKVVEKIRQEQRKIAPLCPFARHEFDNTCECDDIRTQRTDAGANRYIFFAPSTIRRIALMGKAADQVRKMLTPHRR